MGKCHTEATRRKISESLRGRKLSKEHKARISGAQRGSSNSNWRGGISRYADNRVRIYDPDNPMSDSRGYVLRSRLVISEQLGKPLTEVEIVHHRDGDVTNDDRDNLALFASSADHTRFHHLKRALASLTSSARYAILRVARGDNRPSDLQTYPNNFIED